MCESITALCDIPSKQERINEQGGKIPKTSMLTCPYRLEEKIKSNNPACSFIPDCRVLTYLVSLVSWFLVSYKLQNDLCDSLALRSKWKYILVNI